MPITFECDTCGSRSMPAAGWLQGTVDGAPVLMCPACLKRAAGYSEQPTVPIVPPIWEGASPEERTPPFNKWEEPAPAPLALVTGTISGKCEQGEHFKQGDAAGSGTEGVKGCDGAMPAALTMSGAPSAWKECQCACHNATRREMIEAWNSDVGKYGRGNSGVLVVA